ncbi:hypothetical protein Tco_0124847 [Tanacetum coccineum]
MFNQATLKAQAKKWTEHEAKKAKMMEEYNHHISFKADQLPIIKISYVVNQNTEVMTSNNVYFIASFIPLIMECLVNISKRRAFCSLNKDILKIYYSDNQYAVSIKEDTASPCLHSPKTTKERRPIRRIGDME